MLASRSMRNRTIAAVFALLAAACGTINQGPVPAAIAPSASVDEVAQWMAGTYSSAAQATADAANYKSVVLHMTPIWRDRTDGRWLYVEQAMADAQDKPYRQRVYCVKDHAGEVQSMVFELPGDPLAYAGAWKDPSRMNALMPGLLTPRDGCSVHLKRRDDGSWAGGTKAQACESSLRGAAWASSEVTLTRDRIESWDRGFDAAGKQVWGATKGPYIFLKETSK